MVDSGTDLLRLFKDIPGELREVLKNAEEGKLKIGIEYHGLDRALYRLDLISGRIASTIVLASLIVGSSIIVLSKTPPKWHEMPLIGLAGFLVAAVLGALASDIYSQKRKRHRKNE